MGSKIIDLRGNDKKGILSIELPPNPIGGQFGCPDNFEKLSQFIVDSELGMFFKIGHKVTFLINKSSAALHIAGICKSVTVNGDYNSSIFEVIEGEYRKEVINSNKSEFDENGNCKPSDYLVDKVSGMIKSIRKNPALTDYGDFIVERYFIDDIARLINYIQTKDVKYANSVSIQKFNDMQDEFDEKEDEMLSKIGRMTLEIENLTNKTG